MPRWRRRRWRRYEQGKRVGVIGGDHSVPLGAIAAIAQHHGDFGILHIDAHADLRRAYQGFQYSHASIMDNVLALPQVSRLVQVGIRDISHGEVATIAAAKGRVVTHHDAEVKQQRYQGTPWLELCQRMIESLPQQVYVSFDVDGLDPKAVPTHRHARARGVGTRRGVLPAAIAGGQWPHPDWL
jgi:agmatinase